MKNIFEFYKYVTNKRNTLILYANSSLGTGDTLFKPPVRAVTSTVGFYIKYDSNTFLITNLTDPNLLANTNGVETKITLDGHFGAISFAATSARVEDKVKITKITQWGTNVFDATNQFNGCTNLVVDSTDVLYLRGSVAGSFVGIYNFKSIDKVNYLQATNLNNLYNNAKITNPNNSHIEVIAPIATTANGIFRYVLFTGVDKITIDAPLVADFSYLNQTGNFTGKMVMKTPSCTNILAAFAFNTATLDLSECDFSKVNSNNNFITNPLNLTQTDLLLYGWKHNAEQLVGGIPKGMVSGMVWNMRGSTCSSSGWDAKLAMEADYGITFTNLTLNSGATPTPNPWETPTVEETTFSETFSETFSKKLI